MISIRQFLCVLIPCAIVAIAPAQVNSSPPEGDPYVIESMSGGQPTEIFDGITIERITSIPRGPNDPLEFDVGLDRITLEPGITLDWVALLGYSYVGPVQYYVERGVLTIDDWTGKGYITHHDDDSVILSGPIPLDLPAGDAVYAPDGKIGAIHNNGDEPLVILAIVFVPDSFYDQGSIESGEATAVPGD